MTSWLNTTMPLIVRWREPTKPLWLPQYSCGLVSTRQHAFYTVKRLQIHAAASFSMITCAWCDLVLRTKYIVRNNTFVFRNRWLSRLGPLDLTNWAFIKLSSPCYHIARHHLGSQPTSKEVLLNCSLNSFTYRLHLGFFLAAVFFPFQLFGSFRWLICKS